MIDTSSHSWPKIWVFENNVYQLDGRVGKILQSSRHKTMNTVEGGSQHGCYLDLRLLLDHDDQVGAQLHCVAVLEV